MIKTPSLANVSTLVAAAALVGCAGGDGSTPPPVIKSGTATISLVTAPAGLSAIRLRVVGRGISSPLAQGSTRILLQRVGGDTLTFVITPPSGPGPLVSLALADVAQVVDAVVQEASGGKASGYQAIAPAAITVSVQK